jgi:hypothetical protein
MSRFVIEASSYFLRLAEDTVLDFGPPCGLFALIMTGVRMLISQKFYCFLVYTISQLERAFRAHVKTGSLATVERFTTQKYNDIVTSYLRNTKAISERRWNDILAACGAKNAKNDSGEDDDPNVSILEQYRGEIFIPSSP